MKKKTIDLRAAYDKDEGLADKEIWGREYYSDRRGFLRNAGLVAMTTIIGADMVFARNFPAGVLPIGVLEGPESFTIPGKSDQLVILNDKPINAETPAHLLNDQWTPNELFFVRNNGISPVNPDKNTWQLTIEGESAQISKTYTLSQLKSKFKSYTYYLTLECGGNGRKEFNPPAKGNQWSVGAVGCASWTGVRLKDILNDVGIKSTAKYIGYYGKDTHLSGDSSKVVISRGVPIAKALEDETLVAWAMNGQDLPHENGFPLRLVVGGWPASCSGKWLSKIVVRDKVHDGEKMNGQSYRVPCTPVAPGAKVADEDMCIIEAMPVKSLLTFPKSGAVIKLGKLLPIKGHAWAGDKKVSSVAYSIDFGATWHSCTLSQQVNKNAWQHFSANVTFPKVGYYEVWAKATDQDGVSQPMLVPGWNPRGYLNNACHRIAVRVEK